MSAITIADMPKIVRWNGLTVVPVDINPRTLAIDVEHLEACITARTRAIVVTHLFGCREDLAAVSQVAKKYNLLVIEDCAQAFDGNYEGAALADVTLLSFGPLKRRTALCGARLLVKDRDLAKKLAAAAAALPRKPWSWFPARLAKFACLKAISQPPIFAVLEALANALGTDCERVLYRFTRGFGRKDLKTQISFRLSHAAERFFIYRASHFAVRRTVRPLVGELSSKWSKREFGADSLDPSYWLVALEDRAASVHAKRLRKCGVAASSSTASLHLIDENSGTCPTAQKILQQLLLLNASPANLRRAKRLSI